jgi:hypothetical protein
LPEGSIVVGKLTDRGDPNFGFDAQSGEYKDMVAAGIIDSTKVVRVALQDAASVAGLLITTEAMVGDRPEPKGAPGMPPGGMGGIGRNGLLSFQTLRQRGAAVVFGCETERAIAAAQVTNNWEAMGDDRWIRRAHPRR